MCDCPCTDPALSPGGCCTLAATLATGNTTDGNDIVVTGADRIVFPFGLTGPAQPATIHSITPDSVGAGSNLEIAAGAGNTGRGGELNLLSGSSNDPVFGSVGGAIHIQAGQGLTQGGSIDIQAGFGSGPVSDGGTLFLAGGDGDATGGPTIIRAGSAYGSGGIGGDLSLLAGVGDAGQIGATRLGSTAYDWAWPKEEGIPGASLKTNGAGETEFTPEGLGFNWEVRAVSGANAFTHRGLNSAANGTLTSKTLNPGNVYQRTVITEALQTAAVLNAVATVRSSSLVTFSDAWQVYWAFGIADASAGNSLMAYLGITPATNLNPGNQLSYIGFGWDPGDANIQFFRNDGAGAAVKQDTGIVKATTARTNVFVCRARKTAGLSPVFWAIRRLSDGAFAEGVTPLSDLPALTTICTQGVQQLNLGAATTAGIGVHVIGGAMFPVP